MKHNNIVIGQAGEDLDYGDVLVIDAETGKVYKYDVLSEKTESE